MADEITMLDRWRRQELTGAGRLLVSGVGGLLVAGISRHPHFRVEDWSITKAAAIVGGCLFLCALGYRGLASLRARKPVPPGAWVEPFAPVVRSERKPGAVLYGFLGAILFGGLAAGVLHAALVGGDNRLWVPGILAALASAGALVYALYQLAASLRFGRAELRLTAPPSPGKQLTAELVLERAPPDLKQVTVKLECTATRWELRMRWEIDQRVRRRNGDRKRSSSTVIDWDPESECVESVEKAVAVVSSGVDARCLIQIPLRADLPPTDAQPIFVKPQRHAEPGVRYHRASLSVTGDVAGVDLARTFRLAIQK